MSSDSLPYSFAAARAPGNDSVPTTALGDPVMKTPIRSAAAAAALLVITGVLAQPSPQLLAPQRTTVPDLPWMNVELTSEQRADLLIAAMTLEQKVEQISNDTRPAELAANRPPGCGFTAVGRHIQGIPELGIPTVRMVNGGTGVRGGDCLPEPRRPLFHPRRRAQPPSILSSIVDWAICWAMKRGATDIRSCSRPG